MDGGRPDYMAGLHPRFDVWLSRHHYSDQRPVLLFCWRTINELLLSRASKSPYTGKERIRTISIRPNTTMPAGNFWNDVWVPKYCPSLSLVTPHGSSKRLTQYHLLESGSTHRFRQTKWCVVCSHTAGTMLSIRGTQQGGFALQQAIWPESRGHCPSTFTPRAQVSKCSHTKHHPLLTVWLCSHFLHNSSAPEQTAKNTSFVLSGN